MSEVSTARPLAMDQARESFAVGALVTLVLAGTEYAARAAFHLPVFVPRAWAEMLADHVTMPLMLLTLGAFVAFGGVLGAAFGAIRAHLPGGTARGLVIGVVAFALCTLAESARGGSIPANIGNVTTQIALLVLFLLWGLVLDQSLSGAAIRPASVAATDSPMLTRNLFLIQTAAGALLIAALCVPTAWLIEKRPITLPPLPFPFHLPTQPTPIPKDRFF